MATVTGYPNGGYCKENKKGRSALAGPAVSPENVLAEATENVKTLL